MQAAVNIIIPFLLAVFLAIISTPALFWMKKRRISTFFAILIISLVILAAGLLVGALLATSIADFTKTLPEYAKKLEENFNLLLSWLESKGVQVEKPLMDYLRPDAAAAVKMMRELLAQLGTLLKNSFLIYLTMVFILLEASALPSKIRQALDSKETFDNLAHIADNVKRYLALKTALSLCNRLAGHGPSDSPQCQLSGRLGVDRFPLELVPNIGSIIAAVPAVILALLQHGPGTAVLALLGFLVINVSIGNFLEPRLMGQRLDFLLWSSSCP
jgi:predicted PurR-regulated permease PerM